MPALSLVQRLDGAQDLATRSAALAELAREGQAKVDAFFRRRGVIDSDDRADLTGDVWDIATQKIFGGAFHAGRSQAALGYVYGIAAMVLKTYRNRDRRVTGKVVSLEPDWDLEEECVDLATIEETLDRETLLARLLERLDEESQEIARRVWRDGYDPVAIATALSRNIKTIRSRLRQIAEQLRSLLDEE